MKLENIKHHIVNKRIGFIFFILLLIIIYYLLSTPVLAQTSTEYKLLAPLPIGPNNTLQNTVTAGSYIPGIVQMIIGIAGVLAVVKIIFGGIQYMSTDAIGGKSEGKTHITNALWGLLLIISSYIILYTINPNLVKLKLEIEGLKVGGAYETDLRISTSSPTGVGYGPSYGKPWFSDSSERASLSSNGISIKTPTCATIGQSPCTSVAGLSPKVISGLVFLKDECNCTFTVTGGTEYWLHGTKKTERIENSRTQHFPDGNVVDLRKVSGDTLSAFIISQKRVSGSGCSLLGAAYDYNGITFVDEKTHWHVCFK